MGAQLVEEPASILESATQLFDKYGEALAHGKCGSTMVKSGLIRHDGNSMTYFLFLQQVGCVVTRRALVLVRFGLAREFKDTLYGGGSPKKLVCQVASTNNPHEK